MSNIISCFNSSVRNKCLFLYPGFSYRIRRHLSEKFIYWKQCCIYWNFYPGGNFSDELWQSCSWPGPCRGSSYHRNTPGSRPSWGSSWSSSRPPPGTGGGSGQGVEQTEVNMVETNNSQQLRNISGWLITHWHLMIFLSFIFFALCLHFTGQTTGRFTRRI